jgi:hypothetical protein
MGDYLKLSGGVPTDANAIAASAGAADAGKIVKLDVGGKLDPTTMPAGVGAETRVIVASEALAAGDLVNIHSSAGAKVRKADGTSAGKEAHGFVLGAVANGANATVYPEENVISGLSGLTPGARMFLGTTAGQAVAVAPSVAGQVVQEIGVALSATEIMFRPRQPITLA